MKQLAVVLAAVLSLTLVAPALAQPFADVPTDHWAYDAIAELAAKGLIEGYPDGSFKGDRAMTRYEMAMVVARLLARIEAIKIPPLPGDLVRTPALTAANAANAAALRAVDTRLTAKLATIQRLVAEFRAELAALGVRVTAVEEEIAAIRARLDNTRVTGDFRTRYNVFPVGSVSGGGTNQNPDVRLRMRLTFTGRAGPNVEGVLRLWAANNANAAGVNYDVRYGYNHFYNNVSFDLAYVDLRRTLYADLWRVGRQSYTLAGHGPYGVGLLYDPVNSVAVATWLPSPAAAGSTGIGYLALNMGTAGMSDGIRSDWRLGPLNVTAAVFRDAVTGALFSAPGVGTGTGTAPIKDNRILRVTTTALLPGWTLGGSYFQEWLHPAAVVVGRDSGGTGWGVDLTGTIIPGVRVYLDYASWRGQFPGGLSNPAISAWRVGGNINLSAVAGIATWSPTLDVEYHDYGPLPPFSGLCFIGSSPPGPFSACWPVNTYATTIVTQSYAWNMRGWLARLNLRFSPQTTAWILYEGGTTYTPAGAGYSEWWLRLAHTVAPGTTFTLNYFRTTGPAFGPGATPVVGPFDSLNFYRAELLYSW